MQANYVFSLTAGKMFFMKTVLASGVFDGLHSGHRYYLEQAQALGDRLVVVVTSDGHATRTKRVPTMKARERVAAVAQLGAVDEVIIGLDPYDLQAMLELVQPAVIALGHDQTYDESVLAAECRALGWPVVVTRLPRLRQSPALPVSFTKK